DIDRVDHLRRRPEPARSRGQVRPAVVEPCPDVAWVLTASHIRIVDDLVRLATLDDAQVDGRRPRRCWVARGLLDRSDQVPDHLVARAGDPDTLVRRTQR